MTHSIESQRESYEFMPGNIDPVLAHEQILRDPEVLEIAETDSEHARFITDERLAALRVVTDPTNPIAESEFLRRLGARQVYEKYGRGVRNIPLPPRKQ